MRDLQDKGTFEIDDFRKRFFNDKTLDDVSPKMNEYVEMVETYLLVREKSVTEKINFDDFRMS